MLYLSVMLKKLLLIISVLFISLSANAENRIDSLIINIKLLKNGDAIVKEKWSVFNDEGTEWYIPKNDNSVTYSDFELQDSSGKTFQFENVWDIDRTRKEKAFKCGLNRTKNGFEFCWGMGEYGKQTYYISYRVHKIIVSLNDYDMLHYQVINKGMSTAPHYAKVTYNCSELPLDSDNSRIWGFGYNGTVSYQNGSAEFESEEAFTSRSSMINLIRFNKGYFSPSSKMDKTFDEHYAQAMQGASFEDDSEDGGFSSMTFFIIMSILITLLVVSFSKKYIQKTYLGCKPKECDWYRDIPHNGNLEASNYVLSKLSASNMQCATSAYILRMIYQGALKIQKDAKDKIEIFFNPYYNGELSPLSNYLFKIMQEASGKDGILQEKEFKRWSATHSEKVSKLNTILENEGRKFIVNDQFREENRHLLGLKKFLVDFTEMKTKEVPEVHLWKDYMVYASLFGIADKVAKQLKNLVPDIDFQKQFNEQFPVDFYTFMLLTNRLNSISRSVVTATTVAAAGNGSRGGFGGGASFGGGRGFSGGGFGGGAR